MAAVEIMHSIYKPLGAKGGEFGTQAHTETPPETMERCVQLLEAFAELKADMMEEVKDIERKLILPAKLARDALKPMKKVIKKRDDKKASVSLLPSTPLVALLLTRVTRRSITNDTRAAPRPFRRRRRDRIEKTRH